MLTTISKRHNTTAEDAINVYILYVGITKKPRKSDCVRTARLVWATRFERIIKPDRPGLDIGSGGRQHSHKHLAVRNSIRVDRFDRESKSVYRHEASWCLYSCRYRVVVVVHISQTKDYIEENQSALFL